MRKRLRYQGDNGPESGTNLARHRMADRARIKSPSFRWLMLSEPSHGIILGELELPPDAFRRPEVVQPFYPEK
jgi:hypothetical protein